MSRICAICKKTSIVYWKRKSLRATKFNPTRKYRKYPNLQWVHLPSSQRIKACAKCIKAMGKTR